ncbi:MAG: zinc ribbon domain-containing protein [Anaerolineae bacterium]
MDQPNPVCPHCGAATSPNARFCPACGRPIVRARACPYCGAHVSAIATFCGECGKPIETSGQRQAPAPPAKHPAQATATPPVKPVRARPRKSFLILGGCAGVMMLCLIGVAAFYFAFRSGVITQKRLLNLVGLGSGTIKVMNFRDDAIRAIVTPIKPSQDHEPVEAVYNLDAYESIALETGDAGQFRVDIQLRNTGKAQGSCNLNVRGGDQYRVVSLPNGILIVRQNSPSRDPKDLFPETSAFCR